MAQPTQPAGRVTTPIPDIPIRKPTAFWLTPRFIIGFIIAIAAYAYGVQLTGINFRELVTNLPKASHIVAQLLQPDFFEVKTEVVTDRISVIIPGETVSGDPPTRSVKEGPQLSLSTRVVQPGDTVELTGTGFPPNATVTLYWDSGQSQTPLSTFPTDAQGNFEVLVIIPEGEAQGIRFIEARVETPQTGPLGLPQFTLTETARLSIQKMIETIFLALIGTTFTVILTAPLSFLGAHNVMHGTRITEAIYYIVRTFFNILRSIEVLILAVIWAVVVGIGSFAGVLAITIHGIGALGKLYSEAIESIEPGPIEALRATGANRLQVVMYAVLPQVIPQFVSFTFYRWDINVRMATVLGLVGGGGIGFLLIQFINLLQWSKAATAIWLIIIVVMVMDYLSSYIRHKVV